MGASHYFSFFTNVHREQLEWKRWISGSLWSAKSRVQVLAKYIERISKNIFVDLIARPANYFNLWGIGFTFYKENQKIKYNKPLKVH